MGFQGIPGHEFVGEVIESPDRTWIGKRVVGEINAACGRCWDCQCGRQNHCPHRSVLGILNRNGSFAERLSLPLKNLHLVPDKLSDEAAVFTEPLAAAFRILEQCRIKKRDRVILLGDGKLGLLIAQVLKTRCRLLVLTKHQERKTLLEKWGIESYPTSKRKALSQSGNIGIDATGKPRGFAFAQQLVQPLGTIILKTTCAGRARYPLTPIVINECTVIGSRCGPFRPALQALKDGEIDLSSFISEIYPLKKGRAAFKRAGQKGTLKVLLKP